MQNGISKNALENTVAAKGQLKDVTPVRFFGEGNIKLLFIGNSMLWHGFAPQIGWHGDWGMAASAKHLDFVHQTANLLAERGVKAKICIAQLADWERDHKNADMLAEKWSSARDFAPDAVIIRIGENMPKDAAPACKADFLRMIRFFAKNGAKVLITDSFWKNPARDAMLREIADEEGYAFCKISDIEDDPRSMALDEYEHRGVRVHPSDLGMSEIAKRLANGIEKLIKGE